MKKLSIFLLTSILLLFSSCENAFNEILIEDDVAIDVAEEELQEEKEEKKFYIVTGTVGINLPENNARTAMPAVDLTSPSFSSLSYIVEAENQSDSSKVTGEITISATEVKYKIYLSDGTWKLNIKAYTDAAHTNQVFAGSTVFTIESLALSSGSTSVNLTGVSSGTGTVTLPVKIEADSGITSGKAVWSVGGVDKEEILTFDIANSVYEDSFNLDDGSSNAPAGTYTVRFIFYKGPTVAYSFVETVNVFNGLETNKWLNSTSAVYLTGNSVLITKALVQSYALKTFYVDQVNGSNSESGDFFFPVSSVQRAVNMIEAVNDGVSEYSIILKGDFTASASSEFRTITDIGTSLVNITPSAVLNLTIKSNNTTKRTISANNLGRVIYVGPNTNLTMQNIIVSDGNFDVYDNNTKISTGAGVLVQGEVGKLSTLVLDKCIIKNNGKATNISDSKVANGGGLAVNLGKLAAENCEFHDNWGKWGGGLYFYYDSDVTVNNSKIYNNKAGNTGGGIWTQSCKYLDVFTTATFKNCDINNNKARAGAGIYNKGRTDVINSKIYLNTADTSSSDGYGGGIANNARIITITEGTEIYSNEAYNGAGISVQSDNGDTVTYFDNIKIYDNKSYNKGNEVFISPTVTSAATSKIYILNETQITHTPVPSESCSDVMYITENSNCTPELNLSGILTVDKIYTTIPLFLNGVLTIANPIKLDLDNSSFPDNAVVLKGSSYTLTQSDIDLFNVNVSNRPGSYSLQLSGNTGILKSSFMNFGGSIVHTLVLDNDISFSVSTATVTKSTGAAITIDSSINSNPVADVVATYENFKVEILAYGIRTGIESAPGMANVVIPSGCEWPAGKYELYITGKYQGVEYNASLYFDLTE